MAKEKSLVGKVVDGVKILGKFGIKHNMTDDRINEEVQRLGGDTYFVVGAYVIPGTCQRESFVVYGASVDT